jgi:lipopolysaccharide heptosyltransferase II
VFEHLQIYDSTERGLVGLADLVLSPLGWARRRPAPAHDVRRVLLLRLERIGDLIMVLDAIEDARRAWPGAAIDLAVGRWNEPIARLIPGLSSVLIADAAWLARGAARQETRGLGAIGRDWRSHHYDIVINFEPDIRSNYLAWRVGAPIRAGYDTGGGGSFLTDVRPYDPSQHVSTNARALIARVAGRSVPAVAANAGPRLTPPAEAIARAEALLGGATRPIVGVHAAGGRESKQWHLDRFAAVARELAGQRHATIVLTGGPDDRAQVDHVKALLRDVRVIDTAGQLDLPATAALLARLDVLVTGDTGPMHLAAAMATPVVALFGPSNPARYGPLGEGHHVVRIDLPCSPCGQVRLPPERCRGHVPDCLDGIGVDRVVREALAVLDSARERA